AWGASHAARVVQPVAPAGEREVEDLGILDEERATLLEELLEGGEVDHRRVGLHLAEVRVDRGVERELPAEPESHVGPHARALVTSGAERVSLLGSSAEDRAEHVGPELEAA